MTDSRRAKTSALAILFAATAAHAQSEPRWARQRVLCAPSSAGVVCSRTDPRRAPTRAGRGRARALRGPRSRRARFGAAAPCPAPVGGRTPSPGLLPAITIGEWQTRIYGFGELDFMHDSTQAFGDLGGPAPARRIPKSYDYAGSRGQLFATARNSRLGVLVNAPDFAAIRPTFTLEGDFMGNQPITATPVRVDLERHISTSRRVAPSWRAST